MRISVALCTFNGARFLGEQLASIAGQSRRPDEMVICDDGSTDDTAAIVEAFRASFPVHLHRNPQRLGVARNFEKAIAQCTGDVIALADQDDVWYPQKLAAVEAALADADLVFSNARRVDEYGRPLPESLWERIRFRPSGRSLFDVLAERNVVTGATMAFRASWRERLLPIPNAHGMLHDQWIALIVSSSGRARPIDAPLLDYREHRAQERGTGAPKSRLEWARETGRSQYAQKAAELRLVAQRIDSPALEARIAHLERRASLPQSRLARLPGVLRAIPDYVRYSNHVFSIAKDLLGK